MKRTKYATVCGMEFQGETVTLAKAKGQNQIAILATEANIGPSVYKIRDLTVLVWPQLEGWAYRILLDTDNGGVVHPMCQMGGTRAYCVASAVAHAAMWQWSVVDETNADDMHLVDHNYVVGCFWPARKGAHGEFADQLDKRADECKQQMAWQRRYRSLSLHGIAESVAHDIASRTRTIAEALAKS